MLRHLAADPHGGKRLPAELVAAAVPASCRIADAASGRVGVRPLPLWAAA
jgi:hypothetical protein